MAKRFTWTFATSPTGDNVTKLIELYDADYGGASSELTPAETPYEMVTGTASDTFTSPPRRNTERIYRVLASGTDLDALREISGATSRRWSVIDKSDGSAVYSGYVVTDAIVTPLTDTLHVVELHVKDYTQSLDGKVFVDGSGDFWNGQKAFSEWIAEALTFTGLSYSIKEDSQWQSQNGVSPPLGERVDGVRWSEVPSENEPRVAHAVGTVLDSLLMAKGLVMALWEGFWTAVWPMGRLDATTVVQRTYDSAGAYVSGSAHTAAVTLSLDDDGADWTDGSDGDTGTFPARSVRVGYAYGPFRAGELQNGGFEYWEDRGGFFLPRSWSPSGGTTSTDYKWFIKPGPTEADNGAAGGVIEATVAAGATVGDSTCRAAALAKWSQDAGTFPNNYVVKLRFTVYGVVVDSSKTGAGQPAYIERNPQVQWLVNNAEAFYILTYVTGGTTYHYEKSSESWQTGLSAADQRQRVGLLNGFRFLLDGVTEEIELPAMPGVSTGVLTIQLTQPVRVETENSDPANLEVWALWDNVELDYTEKNVGSGIAYEVFDDNNTEGDTKEYSLIIGEGPVTGQNTFAPGAIWLADGTTLGTDFRATSGATAYNHTEMIAYETMRYERSGRRRISFSLIDTVVSPVEAFDFDGERWWPLSVHTVYRGPGIVPISTVVAEQLVDGGVADTTVTTGVGGGVAVLSSGLPSAAILQGLSDAIGVLHATLNVTVLTADIVAGAATTATINAVGAPFVQDDEGITIVNLLTLTNYDLVADGDYTAGSTTLTFDSYVFPETVPSGSYVFTGVAATLVRFILVEAGISLLVLPRRLATVNETIAPAGERGPIGGQLAITALQFSVYNDQPLRIVNNGTGGDGTVYFVGGTGMELVGDQTAGALVLDIDDGAGGEVAFSAGLTVGSDIHFAAAADQAQTAINVKFNTIELLTKTILMKADSNFRSDGWDGTLDGSNRITAAGTTGFCLTGDGDFDATGTLHAGGGKVRIDGTTGIYLASEPKAAASTITFADGYGGTEHLEIWTNNGASSVDSLGILTLKSTGSSININAVASTAQVNITSASDGFTVVSGGPLAVLPAVQIYEQAAPGAGPSTSGNLYKLTSDDGLWWHPNGGAAVDLTVAGGAAAITDGYLAVGTGSGIEDSAQLFEDTTGVAVGHAAPEELLHVQGASPRLWLDNTDGGVVAIAQTMPGLLLTAAGHAPPTFKYGPAVMLGSDDPQLGGERFIAGMVFYATEGYSASTDGGGGLAFVTTPDNPGSAVAPSIRVTIDQDGNTGIAQEAPSALLHVGSGSGVAAWFDASGEEGILVDDGVTYGRVAIAGSIAADLVLYDSGAGVDEKTSRLISLDSTTRLEVMDDAFTGTLFTGWYVDHATGYVGVGLASTPGEQLHVSGNVRVDGNLVEIAVIETKNQPADPSAPSSGYTSVYTLASDDRLYFREGAAGTIHKVITDQDGISGNVSTVDTLTSGYMMKGAGTTALAVSTLPIVENATGLGIGIAVPTARLHVYQAAATTRIRLDAKANGATSITQAAGGIMLLAGNMNTVIKYTPGVLFGSDDGNFGGTAKFLAGIFGYAEENYAASTDGKMGLSFATSPLNPGSANDPIERMTIDGDGLVTVLNDLDVTGDVTVDGYAWVTGQLLVQLDGSSEAYVKLEEMAGDPAATGSGTLLYTKTDNRLHYQNGSPATNHQIITDQDVPGGTVMGTGVTLTSNYVLLGAGTSQAKISAATIDASGHFTTTGTINGVGQVEVALDGSNDAHIWLAEMLSDPAAVGSGTQIYTKTDNRLYFQNGSPGTVHQILTDQDTVGDVSGPGASVTDQAIVVWDGTTGALIKQRSAITVIGSDTLDVSTGRINAGEYVRLEEQAGDPAASGSGTFVYTKTDNRLHYQNGSPATNHQIFTDQDLLSNVAFGGNIGFVSDSDTYIARVAANEVDHLAGGNVKATFQTDRIDLYGAINILLESSNAYVKLAEMSGDPVATGSGTFVYTKTDNRLYFQNGSPATTHKIFTDQDLLSAVTFSGQINADAGISLGDNDKVQFGAGDDLEISHDGTDHIFESTLADAKIVFKAKDASTKTWLQINPDTLTGESVSILLDGAEPDDGTQNFPEIGMAVFYYSGTDFRVKVRTATSTYQTASLGTLS